MEFESVSIEYSTVLFKNGSLSPIRPSTISVGGKILILFGSSTVSFKSGSSITIRPSPVTVKLSASTLIGSRSTRPAKNEEKSL